MTTNTAAATSAKIITTEPGCHRLSGTSIFALFTDDGWIIEDQSDSENPQRISEHDSEDEAVAELATYSL